MWFTIWLYRTAHRYPKCQQTHKQIFIVDKKMAINNRISHSHKRKYISIDIQLNLHLLPHSMTLCFTYDDDLQAYLMIIVVTGVHETKYNTIQK